MTISFRNPVNFVNQWYILGMKIRAILIWCFYFWIRKYPYAGIIIGIRIFGIEIQSIRYY